jgi:D-inositol-3-phosphate glycosyltransferase
MRIAMVSEHGSPLAVLGGVDAGGQNVHVGALSKALTDLGHEVVVYTRRDDPDLPERVLTADGYTVVHLAAGPPRPIPKDELLPFMRDFGIALEQEWSATWRPDIVHAHFWMSGLAAHVGGRNLHLPIVLTFHALGAVKKRHQLDADTSPDARVRIERSLALSSDHVIATCDDEVNELMHMGVNRRRASVVPCGVETDQFTRLGESAPRSNAFRVLVVGRLIPRKGIDTVIEAIARVPESELLIIGGPPRLELNSDPEAVRLHQIALNLDVAQRVTFLGGVSRPQLPPLYRSSDVVACMAWYEPFGIVPLEAMACGKPVIASDVGGLKDTIVDGVTGILVSPRRPDLLALQLRKLINEPFTRQAMGMAATDRAFMRYSWERVATETMAVYEALVSARSEVAT